MRILHTHSATELTVDISTKLRVASFRFVEGAGDVRVVTVPVPALGRLPGTSQQAFSPVLSYLAAPLKASG
jgi:hypothetical protein